MRCTLRNSAKGIYVDGNPMSRTDAVAACKRSAGAIVILEDATTPNEVETIQNEWKPIRKELEQRNVAIHVRGRVEDSPCSMENPLSRGCN